MTFDEPYPDVWTRTLTAAAADLDRVIADDLARLEQRVRHDLIATANPSDPPDWIERNIAALLRLERRKLRAWKARVLVPFAFDRHTPTTPPC